MLFSDHLTLTPHEKCPFSGLFWSSSISPYSVRMRENTGQNNSKYEHFLRRITLFWMGFFRSAHGGGGGAKRLPLPKIYHTYPTIMKLVSYTLPKEDPKNI